MGDPEFEAAEMGLFQIIPKTAVPEANGLDESEHPTHKSDEAKAKI
jgi:hypothetical protein